MPNLSTRVADLFSRITPQPQETQSTVISHSEVVESGSTVAESRTIVDSPVQDVDMDDTPAEQLAAEVADAAASDNPKKTKTPKSATKSPKPKALAKRAKKDSGDVVEWRGATGPDNAVATNEEGEQEWEIAKICKVEDSGKTLVVKWKGWKGFWPEDYEEIKAQVPEMVKDFEKELKAANRNTGKRGRPSGAVVKSSATGAKRGRPPGSKNVAKAATATAAKVTAVPKTARQATASKGRPRKVTKSPAKATGPVKATGSRSKKATASPNKTTPKSPAQAAASTRTPTKKTAASSSKKKAPPKAKASGSGVMAKRGRPKKA